MKQVWLVSQERITSVPERVISKVGAVGAGAPAGGVTQVAGGQINTGTLNAGTLTGGIASSVSLLGTANTIGTIAGMTTGGLLAVVDMKSSRSALDELHAAHRGPLSSCAARGRSVACAVPRAAIAIDVSAKLEACARLGASARDQLRKSLPFDETHRDVERAIRRSDFMHRTDARMIEFGGQFRFALQSRLRSAA